MVAFVSLVGLAGLYHRAVDFVPSFGATHHANPPNQIAVTKPKLAAAGSDSPYGSFPRPNDAFQFLPCTNTTSPPDINNADPTKAWAALFDPDPTHWSWSNRTSNATAPSDDPYFGRGIYMCGYLDVPLDYNNASEKRIFRLAVTKLQVSGLARTNTTYPAQTDGKPPPGQKSNHTIIIEPGGPGGSGTAYAWRAGASISKRFSDSTFDVLGWDPRGVNATQPSIACYPYNADRDRWSLLAGQYRAAAGPNARTQLALADAMFDATFRACRERTGDLARFVGTGVVSRDLDRLREAIGEEETTGYLVSYGTGIGQTYANMFPNRVGRMILDGTEYVRDHREVGGFGWTALDNATDAWRDGVLGECLNAGPDRCALAKPAAGKGDNETVTLEELLTRMETLITGLITSPMPAYTKKSGPSLITYSSLVGAIYAALYNARSWPALSRMLYQLEAGNTTLAATMLERSAWQYDPSVPMSARQKKPNTDELTYLVICSDSYDAPHPDGPGAIGSLDWWDGLWKNMTAKSWISGDSRLFDVLPCRHFRKYWPQAPVDVYRGDLNKTLKTPVLLIAEAYDPATPLRNGRRLAKEMGVNARLIAHHGFGHSMRDKSDCTEAIAKGYIMNGTMPVDAEVDCYANERPYLYSDGVDARNRRRKKEEASAVSESGEDVLSNDGAKDGTKDESVKDASASSSDGSGQSEGYGDEDAIEEWRESMRELTMWNPSLLRRL